jgi:hypothetical protein
MFKPLKRYFRKLFSVRDAAVSPLQYLSKKGEFESKLNIRKGEWFFVSPYGIGDLCIILSLLPEFRKIHKAKKIAIGITNEKHRDIFAVFPDSADRYEIIQKKDLIFCKSNRFEPGNPVIIHPEHIYPSSMQSLIGYKNITLVDIYKILLNLPIGCNMAKPVKPGKDLIADASQRFEEYGLTISVPFCLHPMLFHTGIRFCPEFWKELVEKLQEAGLKTAMMTNRHDLQTIEGVIQVDFPLKEAITMVSLCGFFIGNRSGFCDLVAGSPAMKIILYSTEIWHSGKLIDSCSLKKMGMAGDETFEFEPGISRPENSISKIITLIKQKINE